MVQIATAWVVWGFFQLLTVEEEHRSTPVEQLIFLKSAGQFLHMGYFLVPCGVRPHSDEGLVITRQRTTKVHVTEQCVSKQIQGNTVMANGYEQKSDEVMKYKVIRPTTPFFIPI